jgi:hypothetical protein
MVEISTTSLGSLNLRSALCRGSCKKGEEQLIIIMAQARFERASSAETLSTLQITEVDHPPLSLSTPIPAQNTYI